MNYKAGFIVSFLLISIMHIYILSFKVEERIILTYIPEGKVSNVINLQQVSIKEPEPIFEPLITKAESIPKPMDEKVIPIVKKKPIKKKLSKKKEIATNSSASQISGPKQRAMKDNYFSKIRRIIEQKKSYPKLSLRREEEGIVHIKFTVKKNGSIKNINVIKKSRYKMLNEAAVKLLKDIGSFPSIPKDLGKNSLSITVPIKYNIIQ